MEDDERKKYSAFNRSVESIRSQKLKPKQQPEDWTTNAFGTGAAPQRLGRDSNTITSGSHETYTPEDTLEPVKPAPTLPPELPDRPYDQGQPEFTKEYEIPLLTEPPFQPEEKPAQIEAPPAPSSELSDAEIDARAFFDPHTQAYNFRYIARRLQYELTRASYLGQSIGILVISIDNLEAIAAQNGQSLVDKIIDAVAVTLFSKCRPLDLIGRYLDGKFLIVCPELSEEEACELAESIRVMSESIVLKHQFHSIRLSLSIGIAFSTEEVADFESLIAMAHLGSDMATEQGGNSFCFAANEP